MTSHVGEHVFAKFQLVARSSWKLQMLEGSVMSDKGFETAYRMGSRLDVISSYTTPLLFPVQYTRQPGELAY